MRLGKEQDGLHAARHTVDVRLLALILKVLYAAHAFYYEAGTSIFGSEAYNAAMRRTRSSAVSMYFFCSLMPTPMTMCPKSGRARHTMEWCPMVKGSKLPVKTAVVIISSVLPVRAADGLPCPRLLYNIAARSLEQTGFHDVALIRVAPEMPICKLRHHAPAGRALDKSFHDEERLINLLHGSGIFANGGCNG